MDIKEEEQNLQKLQLEEEEHTPEDQQKNSANIQFMVAMAQTMKYTMEVMRRKIDDKYSLNEEEEQQ